MNIISPKIYEAKMDSRGFRLFIQLSLFTILPLLGYFCRNFTIPHLPLAFSVLWAPAGVSLAFILLFGSRAWVGILLGNLLYNVLNISITGHPYGAAFLASLSISIGSLFQALIAGFIIRRFSSSAYLYSVRDVFIFLFPAGLLSCLIASTVATFAININAPGTWEQMIRTWVTFWLGDSMGVYVFTPLIIILATQQIPYHFLDDIREIVTMALSFIVISWISFYKGLPLPHLMIPLCLWITYRYRMHGAIFSTLLVSVVAVIPSTLGYGVFIIHLSEDPMLYLVSFLEVIIGVNLFVAAIINERSEASAKLDEYTHGLEEHLKTKDRELRQIHEEIFLKEKLASIGMMMAGIGRELYKPFEKMGTYIGAASDCLGIMDKICAAERKKLSPEASTTMENMFETLKQDFSQIKLYHGQAKNVLDMVIAESKVTESGASGVKMLNLHTLINHSLTHCLEELKEKHPALKVTVIKEYDKEVEMIEGVAEDLTHAFINLIENSLHALTEISERKPAGFTLKLMVRTENEPRHVNVTIRDNAGAISEGRIANFFEPFVAEEGYYDGIGMKLAMTHDIIVNEHHGEISINAEPGEFQQINLKLPKTIRPRIQD